MDVSCVKIKQEEQEQETLPMDTVSEDASCAQLKTESNFTEMDIGPIKIDPDATAVCQGQAAAGNARDRRKKQRPAVTLE